MDDEFIIKSREYEQHCVIYIETMASNYLVLWFTEFSVVGKMPDCYTNYVEVLIGYVKISFLVAADRVYFCSEG